MKPYLLAIETSCDETAIAIMEGSSPKSHLCITQAMHNKFGGVVPELAARSHQKNILFLIDRTFKKANIEASQLDAIAFTQGPGLLGGLLVGGCMAKGLAYGWQLPLISVNHLIAHLTVNFIGKEEVPYPFLGLVVSGGHTILLHVEKKKCTVLGESLDDAVGEVFDKTGNLLNFPYPGGIRIDKMATKGDFTKFTFPIAKVKPFHFSFSGVKTAIRVFIERKKKEDDNFVRDNKANLCASIRYYLIQPLIKETIKAMQVTKLKRLVVGGGVAANILLQKELKYFALQKGWELHIPPVNYCTDNGVMIGVEAYFKWKKKKFANFNVVSYSRCDWTL